MDVEVDLNKLIKTLVAPMVEHEDKLRIENECEEDSVNIYCTIYADPEDVGRLIGRNGSIAENIQQVTRAYGRMGLNKILLSVVSNDA